METGRRGSVVLLGGRRLAKLEFGDRNPAAQQTLPRVCYPKGMMREWANEV
jgi:hypothetical protein